MRIAVRQRCEGEAHSNAHIDNCNRCAPQWGWYPACPSCGIRLFQPISWSTTVRCNNEDCLAYHEYFVIPQGLDTD